MGTAADLTPTVYYIPTVTTTGTPADQPAFPTNIASTISSGNDGNIFIGVTGTYNDVVGTPSVDPFNLTLGNNYSVIYKLNSSLSFDATFGLPYTSDESFPTTKYIFINDLNGSGFTNLEIVKIITNGVSGNKILALFKEDTNMVIARFTEDGRGTLNPLTGLDDTFGGGTGYNGTQVGVPTSMVMTTDNIYVSSDDGTDFIINKYTIDGVFETSITGQFPGGDGTSSIITDMIIHDNIIYITGTTFDGVRNQISFDSYLAPGLTVNPSFTGSLLNPVLADPPYETSKIVRQESGNLLIAAYRSSAGVDDLNVYVFGRLSNGLVNNGFGPDNNGILNFIFDNQVIFGVKSININISKNNGFIVSGNLLVDDSYTPVDPVTDDIPPIYQYYVLSYNENGQTQISYSRGYNPQQSSEDEVSVTEAGSRPAVVWDVNAGMYSSDTYYFVGQFLMGNRIYSGDADPNLNTYQGFITQMHCI